MSIQVSIIPTEQVKTQKITSFTVKILELQLHKQATIFVCLFDETVFVDAKTIVMKGADYESWGQDDNYINQFVARSLGFSLQ
jgi:hypothetical protein